MTSVTTECFGLHEALARVQEVDFVNIEAAGGSSSMQKIQSITACFLGCSMTIAVVDEYAMALEAAIELEAPGAKITANQNRMCQLWKENDMKELLSQARAYRLSLISLLESIELTVEGETNAAVPNQSAITNLLCRSQSSFKKQPMSSRSSLRDSFTSLDPSPPYALSLYASVEDSARIIGDASEDESQSTRSKAEQDDSSKVETQDSEPAVRFPLQRRQSLSDDVIKDAIPARKYIAEHKDANLYDNSSPMKPGIDDKANGKIVDNERSAASEGQLPDMSTITDKRRPYTSPHRLEDQAASAALHVTRDNPSSKSSRHRLLDEDGKLTSAAAATSLKYAQAQDLPSFPSQGGSKMSSAGAAASRAKSNQTAFEHWKPGSIPAAGKAAMLAKDCEMDPLWHPESSKLSNSAVGQAINMKMPSTITSRNGAILGSTGEGERTVVPNQRSLPEQRDLLLPANAQSENDCSAALLSSLATWQTSAVTWISLELRKCNPCMGVCACVCHMHRKVQTPQFLHRLIGNLLVGYAGMSCWKPKCNIPICRGFRAKSVRLNYCFPQWFVARTVHITWHTCFGGPGLELSVQRRLPEFEENSVFQLAHAGNCEGVKRLLTQRKIMPDDADAARGCTPLHFAVKASKVETCKALLASGANPNLVMDNGISAIQLAWGAILRHPENQAVQQFRILFPEWQCLEGLELSDLHKTVLGLLHVDFRKMLQRPEIRSQVNCQDTWGKTPLHWAARKSDRAEMEALILAGADVELTDCNRETPLFQAVASSSVECVSLLLAMKANVHAVNIHGEQPIYHASQKSVPLVELLAQAGASLEGNTAIRCLDWAAMGNCVEVAQYLLDLGVQRNVPDWAGNTPVFAAITCHAHEVLELLLHEGVELSQRNRNGCTVLHCVASSGVKRTAEIMLGAELKSLDPFVQDLQGRRAREVLNARIHPPEDLERAFEDLLTRVENDYWYDGMGSDSEEFFDALDMTLIQVDSVEN